MDNLSEVILAAKHELMRAKFGTGGIDLDPSIGTIRHDLWAVKSVQQREDAFLDMAKGPKSKPSSVTSHGGIYTMTDPGPVREKKGSNKRPSRQKTNHTPFHRK